MFYKLIYALLLGALYFSLHASQLTHPAVIFASANNKFVLPIFLEHFYQKYPDAKVMIKYGSSGDLKNSIVNGENYDIFLAANSDYPQEVYAVKKAITPPREYAKGSLILFIPKDSALHQKELTVLNNKNIRHIIIANSATAPYGLAAIEVLKNVKLFETLKHKISYSTDIAGVIESVIWYDNAGFLSKSAVQSLPKAYRKEGVNWIEIDSHLYTPIIQSYVVSEEGSKNSNVIKFLEYLHSDEGQNIYHKFGYK